MKPEVVGAAVASVPTQATRRDVVNIVNAGFVPPKSYYPENNLRSHHNILVLDLIPTNFPTAVQFGPCDLISVAPPASCRGLKVRLI